MAEYDVMRSCNLCGGNNKVFCQSYIEGYVCEADTECYDCGFTDHWAYGHFESGAEIKSKCKKYNAGNA